MTIRHAIWQIGSPPTSLPAASLLSEKQLEDMIVAAPALLDDQWMLIGRQVTTGFAGSSI